MHGLEREYSGRISFVRVNILLPESRPVMEKYSFSATPELYLVNGQGKVIGFWDDSVTIGDLRQAFDSALKTSLR